MPITEDKGLEILNSLLSRPDLATNSIPDTYKGILEVHNAAFPAPVVEAVKPKKKKKAAAGAGWPVGVSRAKYGEWKEAQEKAGKPAEEITPYVFRDLQNAEKREAKATEAKTEVKAPAKTEAKKAETKTEAKPAAKTEAKPAAKADAKPAAKATEAKAPVTPPKAPAAPAKGEVKDTTAAKADAPKAESLTKVDPKMEPVGAV